MALQSFRWLFRVSGYISYRLILLTGDNKDWTWGLLHAKQILYHSARAPLHRSPPVLHLFGFLRILNPQEWWHNAVCIGGCRREINLKNSFYLRFIGSNHKAIQKHLGHALQSFDLMWMEKWDCLNNVSSVGRAVSLLPDRHLFFLLDSLLFMIFNHGFIRTPKGFDLQFWDCASFLMFSIMGVARNTFYQIYCLWPSLEKVDPATVVHLLVASRSDYYNMLWRFQLGSYCSRLHVNWCLSQWIF